MILLMVMLGFTPKLCLQFMKSPKIYSRLNYEEKLLMLDGVSFLLGHLKSPL